MFRIGEIETILYFMMDGLADGVANVMFFGVNKYGCFCGYAFCVMCHQMVRPST